MVGMVAAVVQETAEAATSPTTVLEVTSNAWKEFKLF
jgi:hypothetical protein